MTRRNKIFLVVLFKVCIVAVSLWIIYHQVIVRNNFKETLDSYNILLQERETWWILGAITVMMFLNWLLESLKWQALMIKIQPVSTGVALRAIFSGITVSFFTPNRVGEFAGRILHLEAYGRVKAAIATVVGSMNQLLITVVAGVVALLFTLKSLWPDLRFLFSVVSALTIVALIALIVLYFNVSRFYFVLHRIKLLRKIDEYTRVFSFYHAKELSKITILSAARYIVFNLQYILLLYLLHVNIDFLNALRLISLIFLTMAIVPSSAFVELGIRGSIALYFMEPLSSNTTGIVTASFSLWFINLVIPAVIGAFALLFARLFRQTD